MHKTIQFMKGLIFGGLIGASLIILSTPASGTEIRQQFSGGLKRVRDELEAAGEQRRQELEDDLAKLRSGG